MIIQGTCEVLKQLKKVNARTSVQMERMRREQVAIEIAKKPGIGADPSKQKGQTLFYFSKMDSFVNQN